MDPQLELIYTQAEIPPEVRNNLLVSHGIKNFETLKEKEPQLESCGLDNVTDLIQQKLAMILGYLDNKRRSNEDPLPRFDRLEWMDFCAKHFFGGYSGLEQGGDSNDDMDDNGMSLTRNLNKRAVKTMEKKPSIVTAPEESKPADLGKFEMLDQHFTPSDEWIPPDIDDDNNEDKVEPLKFEYVEFESRSFRKGRCYRAKSATGLDIIVGIISFRSIEEAYCVRIIHAKDTFLGTGDGAEDFFQALRKHYPHLYMQVRGTERLKLAELGEESSDPEMLPELIYEPRLPGRSRTFGYVRDISKMKRVQLQRKDIRMVEGFSGAGGMHLGYKEEGFTTACAVEANPAAVATFKLNNPGIRVFEYDDDVVNKKDGEALICKTKGKFKGDIKKFIAKYDSEETKQEHSEEIGSVDVIHTSSPCQGFSKANRTGGQNDERNNELSYSFVDLLRVTGALVGVFENVEGMWMAKNISYLRKIIVECIALGYQVRVMVLRACDYGDPQARPRLIIFAAKNFVMMPERPRRTHGFNSYNPITTTRKALDFLLSPEAKAQNFPNSEPAPENHYDQNKEGDEKLDPDKLAPAVLASGSRVFHYAEDRLLTVREISRLQSFPLDYEFVGSRAQQIKQAGNAVPAEFARAIARSVRDVLRLLYVEEISPLDGSSKESVDDEVEGEVNGTDHSTNSEDVYKGQNGFEVSTEPTVSKINDGMSEEVASKEQNKEETPDSNESPVNGEDTEASIGSTIIHASADALHEVKEHAKHRDDYSACMEVDEDSAANLSPDHNHVTTGDCARNGFAKDIAMDVEGGVAPEHVEAEDAEMVDDEE